MCDDSVKVKHIVLVIGFLVVTAFFTLPALTEQQQTPVKALKAKEIANRDNFLDLLAKNKPLVDAASQAGKPPEKSKGHMHEDREGRPKLFEMVSRLNAGLSTYFGGPHKKKSTCYKGWKEAVPDTFLAGCAGTPQCARFGDLASAKVACQNEGHRLHRICPVMPCLHCVVHPVGSECGGVIFSNNGYELRGATEPEHSPGGEISYVKILCDDQASAVNVWNKFHDVMEQNLNDKSLNLDANELFFHEHDHVSATKFSSLRWPRLVTLSCGHRMHSACTRTILFSCLLPRTVIPIAAPQSSALSKMLPTRTCSLLAWWSRTATRTAGLARDGGTLAAS